VRTITSLTEMQQTAEALRKSGNRIGFVPTMGYLHEGHLSLIRLARSRVDTLITSIFVNPTQFAPHEDFASYPRDLERDKKLAGSAGTDILFVPATGEMYPEGYSTFIETKTITKVLEGRSRPTHFRGVTTVVTKLFHLTKPHVAVFGQKDAQQAAVVRQMTKDLDFDVEIVIGPTVREEDGLAMSSRNVYLSAEERAEAAVLHQSLQLAERLVQGGERRAVEILDHMKSLVASKPRALIDYVSINDAATLEEVSEFRSRQVVLVSLAVRFGKTRLIDNTLITVP
jgi:pantoate--beta-alanine ligase